MFIKVLSWLNHPWTTTAVRHCVSASASDRHFGPSHRATRSNDRLHKQKRASVIIARPAFICFANHTRSSVFMYYIQLHSFNDKIQHTYVTARGSSVGTVTRPQTGWSVVIFQAGGKEVLFPRTWRPFLGITQPATNGYRRLFRCGIKQRGREADHSPSRRLRMSGALHLLCLRAFMEQTGISLLLHFCGVR
jgi:hypothetical protein